MVAGYDPEKEVVKSWAKFRPMVRGTRRLIDRKLFAHGGMEHAFHSIRVIGRLLLSCLECRGATIPMPNLCMELVFTTARSVPATKYLIVVQFVHRGSEGKQPC